MRTRDPEDGPYRMRNAPRKLWSHPYSSLYIDRTLGCLACLERTKVMGTSGFQVDCHLIPRWLLFSCSCPLFSPPQSSPAAPKLTLKLDLQMVAAWLIPSPVRDRVVTLLRFSPTEQKGKLSNWLHLSARISLSLWSNRLRRCQSLDMPTEAIWSSAPKLSAFSHPEQAPLTDACVLLSLDTASEYLFLQCS